MSKLICIFLGLSFFLSWGRADLLKNILKDVARSGRYDKKSVRKTAKGSARRSLKRKVALPQSTRVRRVVVNGKTRRANDEALLIDGRLYVPANRFADFMKVDFRRSASVIDFIRGKFGLKLRTDIRSVLPLALPRDPTKLPAKLHRGRLFLPARTLAILFKQSVGWEGKSGTLTLRPALTIDDWLRQRWERHLARKGLLKYVRAFKRYRLSGKWFRNIYGTSEEPQKTAGPGPRGDYYMRSTDISVALPDRSTLGATVEIFYPKTGRRVKALVADVGPWNIDDPYWERNRRPQSESGRDRRGRRTNKAGIDLSFGTWAKLGVRPSKAFGGNHSDYVDWRFVSTNRFDGQP